MGGTKEVREVKRKGWGGKIVRNGLSQSLISPGWPSRFWLFHVNVESVQAFRFGNS